MGFLLQPAKKSPSLNLERGFCGGGEAHFLAPLHSTSVRRQDCPLQIEHVGSAKSGDASRRIQVCPSDPRVRFSAGLDSAGALPENPLLLGTFVLCRRLVLFLQSNRGLYLLNNKKTAEKFSTALSILIRFLSLLFGHTMDRSLAGAAGSQALQFRQKLRAARYRPCAVRYQ